MLRNVGRLLGQRTPSFSTYSSASSLERITHIGLYLHRSRSNATSRTCAKASHQNTLPLQHGRTGACASSSWSHSLRGTLSIRAMLRLAGWLQTWHRQTSQRAKEDCVAANAHQRETEQLRHDSELIAAKIVVDLPKALCDVESSNARWCRGAARRRRLGARTMRAARI